MSLRNTSTLTALGIATATMMLLLAGCTGLTDWPEYADNVLEAYEYQVFPGDPFDEAVSSLRTHVMAHFLSGGTDEEMCSSFVDDWAENGESVRQDLDLAVDTFYTQDILFLDVAMSPVRWVMSSLELMPREIHTALGRDFRQLMNQAWTTLRAWIDDANALLGPVDFAGGERILLNTAEEFTTGRFTKGSELSKGIKRAAADAKKIADGLGIPITLERIEWLNQFVEIISNPDFNPMAFRDSMIEVERWLGQLSNYDTCLVELRSAGGGEHLMEEVELALEEIWRVGLSGVGGSAARTGDKYVTEAQHF